MKQETLKIIGRRHTVEDVKDRFHMARELGFDNINMDLIIGLPEEDLDDVRSTMEQVKELGPDSLTVHSDVYKRQALKGSQWWMWMTSQKHRKQQNLTRHYKQ